MPSFVLAFLQIHDQLYNQTIPPRPSHSLLRLKSYSCLCRMMTFYIFRAGVQPVQVFMLYVFSSSSFVIIQSHVLDFTRRNTDVSCLKIFVNTHCRWKIVTRQTHHCFEHSATKSTLLFCSLSSLKLGSA